MGRVHLRPFEPSPLHPFNERRAAHLLRRAGFGASPEEIATAVEKGLNYTIDDLFADSHDEEQEFERTFKSINGKLINAGDPGTAQSWWIYRMLSTRFPLKEKLALFWHGHFATSVNKVGQTELMLRQIDTLRNLGTGSFRDLVLALARDPAMLVWLDGESSTKEHPNENFARELMELFTCGIGNYTEQDVLEGARGFTGWHRQGMEFVFQPEAHDFGVKRFLGKRGKFDGTDMIDLLMAQPATPRFIAHKLVRFFAAPHPAADVVAEATELFDQTQLNIKLFLRELLQSQYFFSEACHRARIASPVEFVVGTARTLNIRQPATDIVNQIGAMGQQLLMPPNVKGWDGEEKWINSSSLAARLSHARTVPDLNSGDSSFGAHCPVEDLVPPDLNEPQKVIDKLADILFQGELAADTRRELETFLMMNDDGLHPESFRDDEGFRMAKVRQALGIMLALPEYQAY